VVVTRAGTRPIAVAVGMVTVVLIVAFARSGSDDFHAAHPSPAAPDLATRVGGGLLPPLHLGSKARRRQAAENRSIRRVLSYTPLITQGGKRHKTIALTFDDGPGPQTHLLIHELRRLRVPATFFQVAQMVDARPQIAHLEHRDGFAVGSHTVTHPFLPHLHAGSQRLEIGGSAHAIEATGGSYPRLFRPPYGAYNAATLRELHRRGVLMVLWSISSRDWTLPGARRIAHTVLTQARPGAIVLMHDAGGSDRSQTIAAVPKIVHTLRRRGYRLVTVPQMMRLAPPPHQRHLPKHVQPPE
jgi:peptidoglycan/xylan/chitin deacetylase (PgdA/CDA1 family)